MSGGQGHTSSFLCCNEDGTTGFSVRNIKFLLLKIDWKTKETKTIIEVVPKPLGNAMYSQSCISPLTHSLSLDNGFAGIYTVALPMRCWDSTGTHLYFSDAQGSFVNVVAVDTDKCHAQYLSLGSLQTYSVMDVADDVMVLRRAEPSCPSHIV